MHKTSTRRETKSGGLSDLSRMAQREYIFTERSLEQKKLEEVGAQVSPGMATSVRIVRAPYTQVLVAALRQL
jgi:hypothetical protein